MATAKRILRNGKYFIVVRGSKGRIRSMRRWKQSFTLADAKIKFNQDKTLVSDTRLIPLTNFNEVISKKLKKPRGGINSSVQASITINGNLIVARSMFTTQKSLKAMENEAKINLFRRVSQEVEGEYDEAVGQKIVGRKAIDLRVVYYAPKSN